MSQRSLPLSFAALLSLSTLLGSAFVAAGQAQGPDRDEQLRKAARDGSFDLVEKLLANPEIHPNAKDAKGWTALMYAARSESRTSVAKLLKAAVDVNLQNEEGETALIIASKRGNVEAARQLLMAGADLSVKDARGRTALEWAEQDKRMYLSQIIRIAGRPSQARVTVAEKPVDVGSQALVPPRVVKELPPLYTESAFNRGIEGRVVLKVIVRKDGSVGPIRVDQSLDHDLDDAAIEAVRTWRFDPATVGGEPINVLANVEIDFIIHRKKGDSTETVATETMKARRRFRGRATPRQG
jgi:TonB family protein